MLKVMTIVGTRPEIIRLARVVEKLDRHCEHILVHTGQNYDYELNGVFFTELNIRRPDQFLDAIQPDLVITDAKIATDKNVERELYRGLDARAPYELVVRHKNYGDVAVYRLAHRP